MKDKTAEMPKSLNGKVLKCCNLEVQKCRNDDILNTEMQKC